MDGTDDRISRAELPAKAREGSLLSRTGTGRGCGRTSHPAERRHTWAGVIAEPVAAADERTACESCGPASEQSLANIVVGMHVLRVGLGDVED
jgi:hypothetical protein